MRVSRRHYKLDTSILTPPNGIALHQRIVLHRASDARYRYGNEAPCGKAINEYLGQLQLLNQMRH